MKAMVIDAFGGSGEFRLAEVPKPEPKHDQILIRVAFASVNPADWKGRAGLLPHLHGYGFPITIGMDCSGIVESAGPGVSAFAAGDRVITQSGMGMGQQGTYAEYCVAPEQRVWRLPTHLSLAEGATIPIAGASAASSILDVARPEPGGKVLVNGGAGSVGTFAIQFLKVLGCEVAATCSTRNLEHVRYLGADCVIDYTRENVVDRLRKWAPDGVNSVIDAVGQHSLPADLPDSIVHGGTLVCIQNLITGPDAFNLQKAKARSVRVLDNCEAARLPDPRMFQMAAFARLLRAVAEKKVRVPPYEILPLSQAGPAHDRVEGGHVRGKLLLEVAGG